MTVKVEPAIQLDANVLLEVAKCRTGLSDLGDDTVSHRLEAAVAVLKEQRLNAAGERAAADVCLWLLTTRLEFFDDRKRYPIAQEEIVHPIFATGEPRAGTTLLHALLSVDPTGRALRFWELMYPSPPPGLADDDDPRREMANEDWRDIQRRIPKWWISHPYNDMLGDGLPEDERTWTWDFSAFPPSRWWRVPVDLALHVGSSDPALHYRLHKMMLQHCQFARPKKYWVLKGFHQMRLKELFDAYPDASVIWTHRDPVQLLASRIVLVSEIYEAIAGKNIDLKAQASLYLHGLRASINAAMTDPLVHDPRVHHVRYQDFVADPISVIRDFYSRVDVPFVTETEEAMREYLRKNPGNRYGKFKYSLDILGTDTDVAALDAEFAAYRARFGIDIDKRN